MELIKYDWKRKKFIIIPISNLDLKFFQLKQEYEDIIAQKLIFKESNSQIKK